MGEQHYVPICFGGISQEEAELNFKSQQQRDEEKRLAAEKAGWTYVVYKYDEKDISMASLMYKISEASKSSENLSSVQLSRNVVAEQVKSKRRPTRNEEHHQQQLDRAREYRKQQYQQNKARRKSRG
jgi:predicted DNA-binding ribbon-helix-helix protein